MENKVYQYYKDLPPWAKGVVVVGGAVVVYLVGSRVYRAVFPTEAQRKNRELEKNIDSEISKLQGNGKKASFSDSNYNTFANTIYNSMRFAVGDDYSTVESTLKRMKNDLDVAKLIKAFGVKQDYFFGLPTGDKMDLFTYIQKELGNEYGGLTNYRVKRINEDWSKKYKSSIDCNNPKGFSQKAHCQGKKKNENMNIEERLNLFLEKNCPTDPGKWSASKSAAKSKFDVYPSAYANGWAAKNYKGKGGGWKTCNEGEANALCEACWDGYKQVGGKMKNGKMVPNCVPVSEEMHNNDYDELDVETIEEEKDFIKFIKEYNKILSEANCNCVFEAEYQGRDVQLGKPTQGDVKKFKVYVKNPAGNIVKVNFGHGGTSAASKGEKTMRIRKSNPKARKSFRARHNCDNPGPRTKARYWSCRKW